MNHLQLLNPSSVGSLFYKNSLSSNIKNTCRHAYFRLALNEQVKGCLCSFISITCPLHYYSLTFPQFVPLKLLGLSHHHIHTDYPFCLLPHGTVQRGTENLLRLFQSKEYIIGSNKLSRCIICLNVSFVCCLTAYTSG